MDKFEFVNWPYERPMDLAKAKALRQLDGTWRPPMFRRPAWCGTLKPLNEKFTHYPNHPCQYLGNPEYGPVNGSGAATAATAAALPMLLEQQSAERQKQMQRQQ